MKKNAGFTLTELMMTVGIMAVVGGIGVTNIRGRMPSHRLEQAQWRVVSDLRAARMEAVLKGALCTVTFDSSLKQYNIWIDANRNGSTDSGELTTKSLANIAGLTMFNYPDTGTFTANGTYKCSWTYQYIGVTTSAGTKYIYVFPSGQVDPWG